MLRSLKRSLARHANNYRGWRTSRKIVVIESDDWGSTCMPSAGVREKLVRNNIRVDQCPYTTFDALASETDLEDLFSVLTEFRDKNNNYPVITVNAVMGNPDFEKIRESGFREYYGEPFTETLKKYPEHQNSFTLWKQGITEGLFFPQFHGREHLNVNAWMKALQDPESVVRSVFNEEMFWPGSAEDDEQRVNLRASFDAEVYEEIGDHRKIIEEGLLAFEKLFGYRSESFIAPNFVCHPDLNKKLSDKGVSYIQGMKYQKMPLIDAEEKKMLRRVQGKKNDEGQYTLVRNCVFEPSQYPAEHDNTGTCLKAVENAFFWHKPAIITAHRLNFIGFIDPQNRERNLKQLRSFLQKLLQKWPDVEFMTSVELGELIEKSEG